MSELTGVGSVEAGNPPAGGNGGALEGSDAPAAAAESRSADAGNLDWAKSKGWVTTDGGLDAAKLAEGYQALEKKLGTALSVPDEKATPEARDEFAKRLGWPGEAKGYEFARPADLPQDIPYDEGMVERFKTWANEARLPKAAAQSLHDLYVKQFAEDVAAYNADQVNKAKAAHETLVKEWGKPGTPEYLKQNDAAIRALRSKQFQGLEDDLKAVGLLTKEGYYTSPRIAALLSAVGASLQNDALIGGGQGGQGNPFAKGDARYSVDEQVRLIRTDPDTARKLASAAGWPKESIDAIGR